MDFGLASEKLAGASHVICHPSVESRCRELLILLGRPELAAADRLVVDEMLLDDGQMLVIDRSAFDVVEGWCFRCP